MEKVGNPNKVIDPSSIRKINCGEICPKCPKDIIGRWVYAVPGPKGKVVQSHNCCGYYEIRTGLEWTSFVRQYIDAGAIRWPSEKELILPSDLPPSARKEVYTKRAGMNFKTQMILFVIFLLILLVFFIPKQKKITVSLPLHQELVKVEEVTVWEEQVAVTGQEIEGKVVTVKDPGWYRIDYIEGKIYDSQAGRIRNAAYDIWGAEYATGKKDYFIYSHILGVKAIEALMIVDGEVGSEAGKVFQFPDNERSVTIYIEKYVRFFRHEPFREDINGNIYHSFQNNSGYWKFKISRKAIE